MAKFKMRSYEITADYEEKSLDMTLTYELRTTKVAEVRKIFEDEMDKEFPSKRKIYGYLDVTFKEDNITRVYFTVKPYTFSSLHVKEMFAGKAKKMKNRIDERLKAL